MGSHSELIIVLQICQESICRITHSRYGCDVPMTRETTEVSGVCTVDQIRSHLKIDLQILTMDIYSVLKWYLLDWHQSTRVLVKGK